MQVECPTCGTSGQIDLAKRPPNSDSVRCPSCQTQIPLDPPPLMAAPPLAAAAAAPSLATMTAAPTAAASADCVLCHQQLPRTEMVRFGQDWVCPACKPDYVTRLRQGVASPSALRYGGFWIRTAAKFLDGIILWIISFVFTMFMGFFASSATSEAGALIFAFGNFLLQIGISIAYSVYFLTRFRATPGKMACGLVVVTPEGETLTASRAVGRFFGEWVSSLILGIGYLMAAFDEEKRTLHDRMCGTRVAYK